MATAKKYFIASTIRGYSKCQFADQVGQKCGKLVRINYISQYRHVYYVHKFRARSQEYRLGQNVQSVEHDKGGYRSIDRSEIDAEVPANVCEIQNPSSKACGSRHSAYTTKGTHAREAKRKKWNQNLIRSCFCHCPESDCNTCLLECPSNGDGTCGHKVRGDALSSLLYHLQHHHGEFFKRHILKSGVDGQNKQIGIRRINNVQADEAIACESRSHAECLRKCSVVLVDCGPKTPQRSESENLIARVVQDVGATSAVVSSSAHKISKMARRVFTSESEDDDDACVLCGGKEDNKDRYGGKRTHNGVTVHHFCALFASGLVQSEDCDTGRLWGFTKTDIYKELARAQRMVCMYCRKRGATIGCCYANCRAAFHFPCGEMNGAMNEHYGTFRSFCSKHHVLQKVPAQCPAASTAATCVACFDVISTPCKQLERLPRDVLLLPCCYSGFLHRSCVQKHAKSAGVHHFRCPLCNNKEAFQQKFLRLGIHIPDQDASWELEQNAFGELHERRSKCDARDCFCPHGRNFCRKSSLWNIILCQYCGSNGTHIACSNLSGRKQWSCSLCFNAVKQNTARASFFAHRRQVVDSTETKQFGSRRRGRFHFQHRIGFEERSPILSDATLSDYDSCTSSASSATEEYILAKFINKKVVEVQSSESIRSLKRKQSLSDETDATGDCRHSSLPSKSKADKWAVEDDYDDDACVCCLVSDVEIDRSRTNDSTVSSDMPSLLDPFTAACQSAAALADWAFEKSTRESDRESPRQMPVLHKASELKDHLSDHQCKSKGCCELIGFGPCRLEKSVKSATNTFDMCKENVVPDYFNVLPRKKEIDCIVLDDDDDDDDDDEGIDGGRVDATVSVSARPPAFATLKISEDIDMHESHTDDDQDVIVVDVLDDCQGVVKTDSNSAKPDDIHCADSNLSLFSSSEGFDCHEPRDDAGQQVKVEADVDHRGGVLRSDSSPAKPDIHCTDSNLSLFSTTSSVEQVHHVSPFNIEPDDVYHCELNNNDAKFAISHDDLSSPSELIL